MCTHVTTYIGHCFKLVAAEVKAVQVREDQEIRERGELVRVKEECS